MVPSKTVAYIDGFLWMSEPYFVLEDSYNALVFDLLSRHISQQRYQSPELTFLDSTFAVESAHASEQLSAEHSVLP